MILAVFVMDFVVHNIFFFVHGVIGDFIGCFFMILHDLMIYCCIHRGSWFNRWNNLITSTNCYLISIRTQEKLYLFFWKILGVRPESVSWPKPVFDCERERKKNWQKEIISPTYCFFSCFEKSSKEFFSLRRDTILSWFHDLF